MIDVFLYSKRPSPFSSPHPNKNKYLSLYMYKLISHSFRCICRTSYLLMNIFRTQHPLWYLKIVFTIVTDLKKQRNTKWNFDTYMYMYYTVIYCNVSHCTVLYNTVLYCTILHVYCTILYSTVLYYTLLYCTML